MPKIAVITPYYKEDIELLRQCHHSVLRQNVGADHFFVADGFPNAELNSWNVKHIILPQAHGDYGDTPRGIGSVLAKAEGYDFIAYLDADNWYHDGHLASLQALQAETNADICTAFRTFHKDNGEPLNITEGDEINFGHVDTSCYLLSKTAFDAVNIWLDMPKNLHDIGDRVFFAGVVHKKYRIAGTKNHSVAYRTQFKVHYLAAGLTPPPDAKENISNKSFEWLRTVAGIREFVERLGFIPFWL